MEHQIGLKRLEEHEIKEIDQALEKIQNGTYGICESCGKDIDLNRLELLPQARLCIGCAKESDVFMAEIRGDKKKYRPSEEQVIQSSDINDSLRGEQFNDLNMVSTRTRQRSKPMIDSIRVTYFFLTIE